MKFKKRLIYYLFGFIIGLMITIFIIHQKDSEFNYLPNDRVLGDFKKKEWHFDYSFSSYDTINILKNSKIEFSKSTIGKVSCNIYLLNQNKGSDKFYFNATNCETKVYYTDLRASSK